MPTVPLVNVPVPQASPESVVRANPGMYAGVSEAGQRLGAAISDAGDLASRVNHATDTAYVIGAQSRMEAAGADFETWTKTNPDTSTWRDEFERRMGDVRQQVEQGGGNLSPMARLHLKTAVDSFATRSATQFNHLATQQNILNAQGTLNEAVNQGIVNNDIAGAHGAIDAGVSAGIIHPSQGAALKKKVTVGVATNQANAAIEQDPFGVSDSLTAKNPDGTYVNFQGLPQSTRETMLFRANKLANETRANTVREWATQVRQAQDGLGIMPDEAGIRAEAAHQGISPKVVDRLLAPPKATGTDAHEFATSYSDVMAYDPATDPKHEKLGELIAQVEGFKGIAHEKLNSLLSKKLETAHPLNSPAGKSATAAIEQAFTQQFLGKWQNKVANPNAAKPGEPPFITVKNENAWQQATQRKAQLQTALDAWLSDPAHQNATPAEATDFVFQQMKPYQQANRASLFRLPSATPTAPKK